MKLLNRDKQIVAIGIMMIIAIVMTGLVFKDVSAEQIDPTPTPEDTTDLVTSTPPDESDLYINDDVDDEVVDNNMKYQDSDGDYSNQDTTSNNSTNVTNQTTPTPTQTETPIETIEPTPTDELINTGHNLSKEKWFIGIFIGLVVIGVIIIIVFLFKSRNGV